MAEESVNQNLFHIRISLQEVKLFCWYTFDSLKRVPTSRTSLLLNMFISWNFKNKKQKSGYQYNQDQKKKSTFHELLN